MSEKKQVVFQIVPRPGEKVWQQRFVSVQTFDDVKAGLLIPGVTKIESPDQLGRYVIPANDPYYDQRVEALTQYAAKVNRDSGFKRIIGPFTDLDAASKALHEARPRTPDELVAEQSQVLKVVGAENAELKAKIAELQAQLTKTNK